MARLHSRKKGKSGTKRPKSRVVPEWVGVDKAGLRETIVKMAKEGVPPAKIGLHLRDQMGVANLRGVLGMPLAAFLKQEKASPEYPEDLLALIRKAARMRFHLKASAKDVHNKSKLLHVESKISRLVKYYSSRGRLPKGWRYDQEQAALLAK
jgi:small subunit ribosomal protein S15